VKADAIIRKNSAYVANALSSEISQGFPEEFLSGFLTFIRFHRRITEPGGIIYSHKDVFPTGSPRISVSVTRNPVTRAVKASQFLGVQMEHASRRFMGIAVFRPGRIQVPCSTEPSSTKNPRNCSPGNLTFSSDAFASPAQSTKFYNTINQVKKGLIGAPSRPATSMHQASPAMGLVPMNPLRNGFGTYSHFSGNGAVAFAVRQDTANHQLSTCGRLSCILMDVHGVPPIFCGLLLHPQ
jgi:hypothetical protein